MFRNFYIVLFLFLSIKSLAQEPITWSTSVRDNGSGSFTLITKAEVSENWRLYALNLPEGGALPTEFNFVDESIFESFSKVNEPNPITKFDPIFQMEQSYFTNEVVFYQDVKIKDSFTGDVIEQELVYQVCDDRVCLFRDLNLEFNLTSSGFSDIKSFDYSNVSSDLIIDFKNKDLILNSVDTKSQNPLTNRLNILLLGLIGGFLALLTPCVFPMIPLTVSFFSSKKKNGKLYSFTYGAFIILIYISLSIPFYFLESINPEILNQISTSPILNFLFFIIFIVFALSLFGLFDFTLPSSWTTSTDSKSNMYTGLFSTFFMALTLVLVSFSCTGPILGTLLVGSISNEGGAIDLTYGMLGFGIALSIPFTLLAFFPNVISKLPKSGSWTNSIKVVLGFIELALAFKFLSNVDLIQEWGILKREVFIIIWSVIFILCGLYLIKQSNKRINSHFLSGFIFIISGVIMSTGIPYNSSVKLSVLSGLLPPEFYSIYDSENDCPLGLDCYKDFDEGLKISKELNKPMLIDFTGWACANCRRVEENTWSDPEIFNYLNNEVVLISLYVDDRSLLEDKNIINLRDQYGNSKILESIGQKWSAFQTLNFNINSQPYYVLVSPDLEILNTPIQYVDTETYRTWITSGLKNYTLK
ncbi:MAG: cytochrome c biogenesis protein CcdA [Bacteroidota bacterium]|nr:cytochrome c biogenesis protein CcdA [Bacteroidota bacterium]